ncbi:MAG: aldose 1-epimerase family protein [Clostridia bacterium]
MNRLSKKDIYRYTGDVSQIFQAKQYAFTEGRAAGVRAVDVNNGSGLQFTVLADRAMDIGALSFRGVNFSYSAGAGITAPAYYDDRGLGWLKTFGGGFLTTCGLSQAGSPCDCDGEELGLHGDISTAPAEELCVDTRMDGDAPEIVITGKMRTGRLFGGNLWLRRSMTVRYGENRIYLKDIIENRGGTASPCMVLYHFNLGYPLLDESISFDTEAEYLRPRDSDAEKGEAHRLGFSEPKAGFREQVFYYRNRASANGLCNAGIFNERLGTGVRIWTDPKQLPDLIQWKNAGYGDYVMGIEPANCLPEGRRRQKEYGLEYLGPSEEKTVDISIEIL